MWWRWLVERKRWLLSDWRWSRGWGKQVMVAKTSFVTAFPELLPHLQLDSSSLFRSTSQLYHIQLTTYCLPCRSIRLPQTPITHSPWRWQLHRSPKQIIFNIWRGASPEVEVRHCDCWGRSLKLKSSLVPRLIRGAYFHGICVKHRQHFLCLLM
jgi:hypothetical protein